MQSLFRRQSLNSAGSRRPGAVSMICRGGLAALVLGLSLGANAQTASWSDRAADAITAADHPAGSWDEGLGLELEGLDAAWYNTANGSYFRYARSRVDAILSQTDSASSVQNSSASAKALFAHQLLLLYRVTLDRRYYNAAVDLHDQIAAECGVSGAQPEPSNKKPSCVAQPFLAEYASVFQAPRDFAGITKSFESAEDQGSAQFAASLVDALRYYPPQDPGRGDLIALLHLVAARIAKQQSSSDCLAVYALAKGARLGYLPLTDLNEARQAWNKIIAQSHDLPAKAQSNPAELGGFLIAAAEMDHASTAGVARGDTVLVDAWFNSQQRKNAAGQMESFHYKWTDMSDSGYSLLGHVFRSYGTATEALDSAPTQENLRAAQFYLIVSPDIPVKNPNPHYMTEKDASEIAAWVKQGGVLILMENDPPNADIEHLNLLADHFGIHFNDVLHHHVVGEQLDNGRIPVTADGTLFHQAHTFYMKDTCSISLRSPAVALLRDRGDVVMASVKYGRGTVFANVDPWIYNEYADGRKNPQIYNQFDNFAGGKELVQWLLQQCSHPTTSARKKEIQ